MSEHDRLIEELAALVGIATNYVDQTGTRMDLTPASRSAVLEGLGLRTGTIEQTRAAIDEVAAVRRGLIPAIVVVDANQAGTIPLRDASGPATWSLTDERGNVRGGKSDDAASLHLPPMPAGYYRLSVSSGGRSAGATLISAPRRCWEPAGLRTGRGLWGVTAQVYGLRSPHNLGIGDYTDVAEAASGAGGLGASFLGLSPLHALFEADRAKFSPYSPSSRLFLESLHIDPTAIAGFAGSKAAKLLKSAEFREEAERVRAATLVDHQAVWALKRPLLDLLFADFEAGGDHAAFVAFREEFGEPLELHATFEALSEHFRAEGRLWSGEWPEDFRSPDSEVVAWFRREKASSVSFHAWLQWQADLQLATASAAARKSGMGIGLYRDLAVGADRGGSEVWAAPERFSGTLSIGAPPDPLGPQGQNWGLPPFDPLALERQGLAAFRALVTANMRHAGAIRIDHAFQLRRLFVIPPGGKAADGAYLDFPFEGLLAVLRLESHRNRCLIIAEDLGTAPEGFSDAIMAAGLLSYRVMYFERGAGGRFKPPEAYPREAMSVFTTHDLPTLRGWWRGLDIDVRQSLGIYDHDTAERERAGRQHEIGMFCQALVAEHLLDDPTPPPEPPLEACVRFLARTGSALASIQFEDAAGELNQANLPGIETGHPNWQRRLSVDVGDLVAPGSSLAKLASVMSNEGRGARRNTANLAAPPPRATYRLQFHKHFTFDDAARIVPYLAELGISHLYASPITQARPGSTHGYDIVDHSRINSELGGDEAFVRLSDTLKQHGLGLILDIVPNHMGVGGADNAAWLSVLEWGELSPLSDTFDVDWGRLGAGGKLVVPFLGNRYGEALEKGELHLVFDAAEGSFSVWHWEHRFPVCPLDYPGLLDRALAALGEDGDGARAELLAIGERLRAMAEETSPERRAGFPEEAETLKARLAAVAASPIVKEGIERAVTLINGVPENPESMGGLHRLLEAQYYRLAHWRVAASDINYRRFFDINSLGGIRVEQADVFERTHELIFRLVREDRVQGLRIDHIDGLADPEGYARALQGAVGPGFYVVVEKILEPGEKLRPWPVAGTTGYDVLNQLDGVFVEMANGARFENIYRDMSDLDGGYGTLLRAAKEEVLETSFASELEVLVSDLKRIADVDRATRDYTIVALRRALVEIVARFPVYRTYIGSSEPEAEDLELLDWTLTRAKRWSTLPDRSVHDFIHSALIGSIDAEGPGRPSADDIARFRRRFQQLTGPVMAKSLEDTLFYRYVRLISLNEVGGDPDNFGDDPADFHALNAERAKDWPAAMIATATHDTKRGEDARARINALSEMPDEWARALDAWREICTGRIGDIESIAAPDGNDQYMMLQSILGAWPLALLDGDDHAEIENFRERMKAWAVKALREAKRYTSWVNSDEAYEKAATDLLDVLIAPDSRFLKEFRPLAKRLSALGFVNSLSRTVLKCTLPGVPDIYQGTEFWDFSLVDPDNRRPVDYAARGFGNGDAHDWKSGRIKQTLLRTLLADRTETPDLYVEGDYRPVQASGAFADNLLAFIRTSGSETLFVAVPRLISNLMKDEDPPLGAVWGDTSFTLPDGVWKSLLPSHEIETESGTHSVSKLFAVYPFAVLRKSA